MHAGRRVLFLDQGMLKSRHGKPIHGVELFRLRLVAQLLERGLHVTLSLDPSWKRAISEHFPDPAFRPVCRYTPPFTKGTVANGIAAVLAATRPFAPRYDAVVFGNARRGLIPAMRLANLLGVGQRRLAFSHRHPKPETARAIARLHVPVLAVSEDVATNFRDAGVRELHIHYGLPNTEAFSPPEPEAAPSEPPVRFILLGRLPNVSKGHRRAVEAFAAMPDDVRSRCELHLASFVSDDAITDDIKRPGVVAYTWTPPERVPELLRSMHAMLTISSNETFSQAIVQGMLTGLPIIATPLPVYTEKLDTGGGIVCETTEQITAAMVKLASEPQTRAAMGEVGRRTALERYVWSTDHFLDTILFPKHERPSA